MAWIKDLGNVKGDSGDLYLPQISVTAAGSLHIGWEQVSPIDAQETILNGIDLPLPVYIPGNPDPEGNVVFDVSDVVKNVYGPNTFPTKTLNLKGDPGEAIAVFNIEPFTGDISTVHNPNTNTIYVENTAEEIPSVYIYNGSNFIMLEGLDLSNYYTKTETYSQTEINNMFAEVNSQMELAYKLLDIEEIFLSNDDI